MIRTARKMGLRSVAVYSDADAELPFVTEADAAVRIGAAPAGESYLEADRVIAAAVASGATLVHPGYGFLSERADFAAAVAAAGLRFVGPSPEVLRMVGDKAQAKAIAEAAGVPVLPGYRGADQLDETFLTAAETVGYPVMLKPAAGGGGIGMQLVTAEPAMRAALARARRTAQGAFGDERLILERAVLAPRHVEVQLLGDAHGTLITVGERDCSAQRRHQKVLEETPAPSIGGPLRTRIAAAALAIAERVGYTNAGKSTLLNLLAGADVLVADRPFATLDPTTRRAELGGGATLLLSDTVGFVNKLPTALVAAFKATLEELTDADLLVHVVDAAHPNLHERITVVNDTLASLGLGSRPRLVVLNKADALRPGEGEALREALGAEFPQAIFVSARTGAGIEALRERLAGVTRADWKSVEVTLPYDTGGALVQRIREHGSLLRADYGEGGIAVSAEVPAALAAQLEEAGTGS
ncbi:MAG: hypothetical protein NVS9B6_15920 [Candidatus Limnocylindrales bacterium]